MSRNRKMVAEYTASQRGWQSCYDALVDLDKTYKKEHRAADQHVPWAHAGYIHKLQSTEPGFVIMHESSRLLAKHLAVDGIFVDEIANLEQSVHIGTCFWADI